MGGPGLAGPNPKIMEDFLSNCGSRVDYISWHRYASGKVPVPTDTLMAETPTFGNNVRNMRALVQKYIPDRKIEIFLGEYNMCWAWTPSDPRQATPVGAIWAASILKQLIDAKLDGAMTWHSFGGGTFGLISDTNELRPMGQLLEWMNRWVGGSTQFQADSSDPNVEAIAASSDSHDIVLLINKGSAAKKVALAAGAAARTGTLYQIADGQAAPAQSNVSLFSQGGPEQIAMNPYSLNLYVLDRIAGANSPKP